MKGTGLARGAVIIALLTGTGCRAGTVWSAQTPDLRSRLEARTVGNRTCVRHLGREQGCFDALDVHSIAFDSLGRHAAYAVRVGDSWAVAVDGVVGTHWSAVSAPVLSPDGAHVAYAAQDAAGWRVVRDGVAGEMVTFVRSGSLRFDATGAQLAYVAGRPGAVQVVLNGKASAPWREVTDFVFAPRPGASSTLHAVVQDSLGWRVVSDGVPGPPWAAVASPRELRDGRLAFVVAAARRQGVVVSGDSAPARWHDSIAVVAAAPDGRVAYVARDGVSEAAFTADGVRIAGEQVTDIALGREGRVVLVQSVGARNSVTAPEGVFVYDIVVSGTLQYLSDIDRWAVLVGNRARRELRVVLSGRPVGRGLDWDELTRRIQQGGGSAALRSWVAAEARRAATGG